jgi:hypothetical protein
MHLSPWQPQPWLINWSINGLSGVSCEAFLPCLWEFPEQSISHNGSLHDSFPFGCMLLAPSLHPLSYWSLKVLLPSTQPTLQSSSQSLFLEKPNIRRYSHLYPFPAENSWCSIADSELSVNTNCGQPTNKMNLILGSNKIIMVKETPCICLVLCRVQNTFLKEKTQNLEYIHGGLIRG